MDFQSLASELLARSESLCREWFPAGKKRGHEYVVGDLQGGDGDSLSINLNTGKWADFATGEAGGDFISLYAAMNGIGQADAYKQLTNGHAPEVMRRPAPVRTKPAEPSIKIVMPAPDTAPAPDFHHFKLGDPVATWHYRNADGETLGYIARYETGGKKEIIPFAWSAEGKWVMKQMPDPRPLYGLDLLAARPDAPVMIVEGEKAADAARSLAGHVYVVVTWPGGSNAWQKADFTPLAGRKLLLWPDADDAGRKCMAGIATLMLRTATEVKALCVEGDTGDDAADFVGDYKAWAKWAGALVKPVIPPQATVGNGASSTPSRLPAADAAASTKPSAVKAAAADGYGDEEGMIFAATPMKTAQMYARSLPDNGKILFWRGEFYTWSGMHYAVRDQDYVRQAIYHFMEGCRTIKQTDDGKEIVQFSPKRTHVEDVMHALRAVCYVDMPEPPTWIIQLEDDQPAREFIAFRNGMLHWPSRTLYPSNPRLFMTSVMDCDYDDDAPEPVEWMKFLKGLWGADTNSMEALACMFGYLLTDDTAQQKAFMLIGPTRSGKGTILRVLESLVGYQNRVSPSLSSLGTQFGLQPLIGKRLAMISDARLSGKTDQQPIVENILRITGEDSLSIDRKNMTAWSGKLATRFVFASNEIPAFSDASAALAGRFVMFSFTRSFLGQEDRGLTARLLNELPGIVLWALDGLSDLHRRGYLIQPKAGEELAEELRIAMSPISTFIEDRCILKPGATVTVDEVFDSWVEWCKGQGRDHPGTKQSFGTKVRSVLPHLLITQPRISGTRVRMYEGLRLRTSIDV